MEDAVIERTKAGDADAWRALVARYLSMVRAICTGYGLDERGSAEVNQVVWLRLVEHLPRIRTPDAIGGWIAATTRSECLDPRRDRVRDGCITADVRRLGCSGAERGGARSARLARAFARLGAPCQRLLRLLATTPPPTDEHVSAALDIAVEQVPAACTRCLERLGRLAAAEGRAVQVELERLVAVRGAVPGSWWDAAGSAFAWLTLDALRADLVYDSTTPSVIPSVGAPGVAPEVAHLPARQLRFSVGGQGVDLALATRDDEVVLTGHLAPGRAAAITIHWPGGTRAACSDARGCFLVEHLPMAPLCIEVVGAHPLKTGWIVP